MDINLLYFIPVRWTFLVFKCGYATIYSISTVAGTVEEIQKTSNWIDYYANSCINSGVV